MVQDVGRVEEQLVFDRKDGDAGIAHVCPLSVFPKLGKQVFFIFDDVLEGEVDLDKDAELLMGKSDVVRLEDALALESLGVEDGSEGFEVRRATEDVDIGHGAKARVFVDAGC